MNPEEILKIMRDRIEEQPDMFDKEYVFSKYILRHDLLLLKHQQKLLSKETIENKQPDSYFKCQICANRKYVHEKYFKQHMSTCHGAKTFKCPICENYFSTAKSLSRHKRRVYCDEQSIGKSEVSSLKVSENFNEVLQYCKSHTNCRYCGKKIPTKVNRVNHMLQCKDRQSKKQIDFSESTINLDDDDEYDDEDDDNSIEMIDEDSIGETIEDIQIESNNPLDDKMTTNDTRENIQRECDNLLRMINQIITSDNIITTHIENDNSKVDGAFFQLLDDPMTMENIQSQGDNQIEMVDQVSIGENIDIIQIELDNSKDVDRALLQLLDEQMTTNDNVKNIQSIGNNPVERVDNISNDDNIEIVQIKITNPKDVDMTLLQLLEDQMTSNDNAENIQSESDNPLVTIKHIPTGENIQNIPNELDNPKDVDSAIFQILDDQMTTNKNLENIQREGDNPIEMVDQVSIGENIENIPIEFDNSKDVDSTLFQILDDQITTNKNVENIQRGDNPIEMVDQVSIVENIENVQIQIDNLKQVDVTLLQLFDDQIVPNVKNIQSEDNDVDQSIEMVHNIPAVSEIIESK